MKSKRLIAGITALYMFALTSCSNIFYPKSNTLEQIKEGMTPQEVTDLLGKPEYRRLNYGQEEWEFRKILGLLDNEPTIVIVRFEDGRLVYMDSFKESEREARLAPPTVIHPQTPSVIIVPGHVITGQPISEKQFNDFYKKVTSRHFKDEQMKLIRAGVEKRYFTCRQCARMMSLYNFDDDKIKVLRMFAPRIVDKENYETIEDEIFSLIEKEKVTKILGL